MSLLSLIPGPAGWALRLLGTGKTVAKGATDWLTGNVTHLLLAALAVALAWGWLGHHDAAKWKRQAEHIRAGWKADVRDWAFAEKVNRASIVLLTASLRNQSAAVEAWSRKAQSVQQAARAAQSEAQARGATLNAMAARIEAERASGCKSGAAVIAAKGEL